MIRLEGVEKSFARKPVLKNIDLRLEPGKTHVLLGESGSGKSTLFRLIMGLSFPDRGKILIGDDEMTARTQRVLVRKIGYVPQDGGLFPHLTAHDNIALVARTLGWEAERLKARMRETAAVVGLEAAILEQYPIQLSGGQRQRIALARAIFLDPEILLLDEPLGALDPIVRSRLQVELREIFSVLKKQVVLVTHDVPEAAFFGDRLNVLYQGEILQTGTFAELSQQPAHPYIRDFLQAQRFVHQTVDA